jgi:ATP-binding protein involved in chromosome partitioning
MKIAIPYADGRLALHFGHCEGFVLFEVDREKKEILSKTELSAPEHEPGLFPQWLAEQGAEMIIAGGMGGRARTLFLEKGIEVIVGAPCGTPEELIEHWLAGTLRQGENLCDH